MPPRRAKRRLTRMDAACDHLERMGFSRAEVRNTVNHLLKDVYLGVDAWPFLEEYSYRVLIEAMLEKQETEPEEPPKLDYPPVEQPTEHPEACESVDETRCIGETSTSLGNLVETADVENAKRLTAGDALENEINGEICMLFANGHSTRRRPPGYGWTSEDEDETVLALPPTTCKKQAMVQCSLSCHNDRKRESQWDVKPDDGR